MKRALLPLVLLAPSSAMLSVSSAAVTGGSQTNAPIVGVQGGQALNGDNGNLILWFTDNNGGTPPACATSRNYFAIDPTTAQGRDAISLVQLAFTTGRAVTVQGTGQCTLYPAVEDLGVISFKY